VFEACYLQEEKMAKDHRRLAEEVVQGILLDNPSFLKEIVERMLQELMWSFAAELSTLRV